MTWPADTRDALDRFYGRHVLTRDGQPTAAWEADHLVRIKPPFPMRLAWDLAIQVKTLRCHKKVADSLETILQTIRIEVGMDAIERYGLDLFGGIYNYRPIKGTARLSVHAWGAAIDLNPAKNRQGTVGTMPIEVVEIFEDQGWQWGGRWTGRRRDPMHAQATQ